MKCPKCGAPENQLDWRIDDEGNCHWNCFECEHEWDVPLKKEEESRNE